MDTDCGIPPSLANVSIDRSGHRFCPGGVFALDSIDPSSSAGRPNWPGKALLFRFLLLVVVLFSAPVAARDWYVAPDGDNALGDGSRTQPFRTVTHVLDTSIDLTREGDTIILRNGVYHECDVRLRKRLTLRSETGERAHIQCSMKVKDSVVVQIDPEASGTRIADLELSGSMYYGIQLQTGWYRGEGQHESGASNIMLENLKIHDTGRDGIKITPKCDHVTIRKSEIWNTGAADPPGTPLEQRNAEGIDNVGGSHMLVEDNHIHDTATTGLYFKGGASHVVVQRNRIENTGMAGILVGFDTSEEYFDLETNPQYYESIGAIVRNNIVRYTGYAGIGLYAARSAQIMNNTITDAARIGHAAIYFGIPFQDWNPKAGRPPSVNPTIRNNLIVQDGGTCIEVRWSRELGGLSALSGAPGTDYNGYQNRRGDCRFVDMRPQSSLRSGDLEEWQALEHSDAHSLSADFKLDPQARPAPSSPAIGAGISSGEIELDISKRPRSGSNDLGALQSSRP